MSESVATIVLTHIGSSDSVTLPSPAPGSTIETNPNQSVQRSAAGDLRTYSHGALRFRVTRTFEALQETTLSALYTLLATAGWVGGVFSYEYNDPRDGGSTRTPEYTLIEPPTDNRQGLNLTDVTLVFETVAHPDAETDRSIIV